MRIRFALLGAPLLLLSFVALAQPKRAAKEAEDKAAAGKAEKADKGESKSEPAPGVGSDDLGGPPPPKAAAPGQDNKGSPLNPEANEFGDGGTQATARRIRQAAR